MILKKIIAVYPGERGSFAEIALKNAVPFAEIRSRKSFIDTFHAINCQDARIALVPVENSNGGSVDQVYDLIAENHIVAIAEVYARIHHNLIINPQSSISDIKRVYSHPQALAQCREYLTRNGYEAVEYGNTAASVKMIKDRELYDSAAIASEEAASIFEMTIAERNIQDREDNITRFLIICKEGQDKELRGLFNGKKEHKTSLLIGLHHEPGALYQVLGIFASSGANLTRINSRPTRQNPWEYVFHIDFIGDCETPEISKMLDQVREKASFLKVIGSYSTIYGEGNGNRI